MICYSFCLVSFDWILNKNSTDRSKYYLSPQSGHFLLVWLIDSGAKSIWWIIELVLGFFAKFQFDLSSTVLRAELGLDFLQDLLFSCNFSSLFVLYIWTISFLSSGWFLCFTAQLSVPWSGVLLSPLWYLSTSNVFEVFFPQIFPPPALVV